MIVTLTANPSIDRTVELSGPLVRGAVQRATRVTAEPGGKGVNVARAVNAAGQLVVAVLPSQSEDPLVLALREQQVPYRPVPVPGAVRVNLTVAEPDGTTTKINELGSPLTPEVLVQLEEVLRREAGAARWAVLSGSLPPGVPDDWYATLVRSLRDTGCSIAVDTSGAPLSALMEAGSDAAPDLLKPNSEELAQITGLDADALEADPRAAAAAARLLLERGLRAVLASLGARGAVLVTADGAWLATPPPIVARSTVAAGDSALSGYLLADLAGAGPEDRLRNAVAYGAGAAALPGSMMPTPGETQPDAVVVEALDLDVSIAAASPGLAES